MKITVTSNVFHDWMNEISPSSFSYEGKELLFELLGEEDIEFDPIQIAGDYSEKNIRSIAKEYGLTYEEYEEISFNEEEDEWDEELVVYDWETMTDEQVKKVVQKFLEKKTMLLGFTSKDTVIYLDFS